MMIAGDEPSVEEQLREMQKKLREISSIPFLIQSTIAQVTQALEKFCPPEPEPEPEPEQPEVAEEQLEEKVDLEETVEEEVVHDEDSELTLETLFDESLVLDDNMTTPDDSSAVIVEELTAELLEEERIRQEKLQKIAKLDRSWPWNGGFEKKIYKRSNCYLVPGSRSSRIQEK
jgi:hypothetical protein